MIFTYFYRNQRAKPIIIDPGLYLSKKSDLALTTQRRSLPTSFTLFTGKHVYIYAQILLKKNNKGEKVLHNSPVIFKTNQFLPLCLENGQIPPIILFQLNPMESQ